MSERIQLLPDHIANQIAAGEVIQRPASAVKELLENAVDAGATEVRLIVNDAGKALIQVIDNGSGMSELDARMAFERHATSKIRNIDDLFSIRTMGFRGEALASIAAVAQVELKTRRPEDELGTCIDIENSAVQKQQPVAFSQGTSIAMKNLFFSVPARRNFLKSNNVEMRHIVDEFIRVAMSFPAIFFSLTSNGQELFHLESGNLKQRLVQILGNSYASKLVPVQEKTDYLNIHGFIGKPDTAKRTRGDQYFFVNNRFIRSPYLNHALQTAFQELIPADSFPMYVLFIELDPAQVDVNVHPTKQEIKFEDEKIVYAFVQAAVKRALAQFSIAPTLDFDLDASIQQLDAIQKPFTEQQQHETRSSDIYQRFTEGNQAHFIERGPFRSNGDEQPKTDPGFQSLGVYLEKEMVVESRSLQQQLHGMASEAAPVQIMNTYIVMTRQDGFLLIHQQSAHERVIYERLTNAFNGKPVASQNSLFPATIELSVQDAVLMQELMPDLNQMGYQVELFGKSAFVIHGSPADIPTGEERKVLEQILEQFKHFSAELKLSRREWLMRTVSWQQAIRPGVKMDVAEMQHLIASLFACAQPSVTPTGRPVFTEFKRDQLERMFGR